MIQKKLLLHTCCAPCFSSVFEFLQKDFEVTSYFYNPNIAPFNEYNRRMLELDRYSALKGYPVLRGEYDVRSWTDRVKKFRLLGERSERCWECYRVRLEKTFIVAKEHDYSVVATTLSVSPHKNADKINALGTELGGKFRIEFLEADFKKNNGYLRSVELSKINGFYRQKYCGCIYSKMERDENSTWHKKFLKKA